MIMWLCFFISMWYWELVFHIGTFGFTLWNPILALSNTCLWSAVISGVCLLVPKKAKKFVFWFFQVLVYILFGVQTVYFHIFKQPLQWKAAVLGGGDALTNYYKEAARGVLECVPLFLVMVVPLLVLLVLRKKKILADREWNTGTFMRVLTLITLALVIRFDTMYIGKKGEYEFYEEYTEFYDPITVMRSLGMGVMVERDLAVELEGLWKDKVQTFSSNGVNAPGEGDLQVTDGFAEFTVETIENKDDENPEKEEQVDETTEESQGTQEKEEVVIDTSPNVLEIDFAKLQELAGNGKEKQWLVEYLQTKMPTLKNEYTGMFEGYNLIFLTAEGFSTYAVREDLTPTLYKLVNSGFVFPNYYVPLWQTSTSDGEYINCTGLIPDGQFSMRKSGSNHMEYTLPRYFSKVGAKCYAFHNNSLTYYERNVTHPNLGYEFLAAKKGDLSQEQAQGKIFPMEHPGYWPASDYEMMQGTLPYYEEEEQFLVYYMTVSGHMNYNFSGNRMSSKNKEYVQGLDMSENARAYIACQIELDKALEYLIAELERQGILDKTVICLSADHYPYAMTAEQYEELAGKSLDQDLDIYRNSLILWNSQIEEPIVIDKVCGSMDLLPTILNLFGFPYDSRMYAGKDILGSQEGMVIFNDRSFVTDSVAYNKKNKTTTWYRQYSQETKDKYLKLAQEEVKNRYQFSAYVLRNDFYYLIEQCR